MAKLSLRDPARAAHLAPYHIKPYTDAERAESAARRAARDAAKRAAFGDQLGDRSPSESELAYSRRHKCDEVGGESVRRTSPHMGIGTTHIDEGNIGSTNASGMLRDDVRGEGLEAYCVNSVNPVTPNPHSIVNGTNREREVIGPTLTRPRSLPSLPHIRPAVGGRPASTGALLARRSCAVCTYDFYPRATPSRPYGYSYCVPCHNNLNLRYKRGRQALLRQMRRAYLISRGDLAPDAGVGGAAGSSPDEAALLAYRG